MENTVQKIKNRNVKNVQSILFYTIIFFLKMFSKTNKKLHTRIHIPHTYFYQRDTYLYFIFTLFHKHTNTNKLYI